MKEKVKGERHINLSRQGAYYLILNLTMLIAALNFANRSALYFSLLCLTTGCLSLLQGRRLCSRLRVSLDPIRPVFARQAVQVRLKIEGRFHPARLTLRCQDRFWSLDLHPTTTATTEVLLPGQPRGIYPVTEVNLEYRCALGLGLFRHRLPHPQSITVYPAPAATHARPVATVAATEQAMEIKPYQAGTAGSRIHWKSLAAGRGLHTLVAVAESAAAAHTLDWREVIASGAEQRWSILAQQVLDHQQTELPFALLLPTESIPAGRGPIHQQRCLTALARIKSLDLQTGAMGNE